MMAVEGPFLAAIIARLPEAKFNLAAYGVAYSFALLSEAPVIMMLSASTALVKDNHTYTKLRNFNTMLIILVTFILLIGLIPPFFEFITMHLINLPQNVSDLTYTSMVILIPWPGAIALRRFLQGILIVNNKTRLVSYGTMIRISAMGATGFLLFKYSSIPGAFVGASALTAGVVSEVIMTAFICRPYIKKLRVLKSDLAEQYLRYREIARFYYPLALATFIGLGSQPLITFMVGHSNMALESLAILPVINALVFIFRSMGLSYQEVGIALMGKKNEGYKPLRNFALKMAVINTFLLGLIAFTPLAEIWFIKISGLNQNLAHLAVLPTQILVLMPALNVLISFQRAMQVVHKKTGAVSTATALEVTGIILVMIISIQYINFIGATAAALAMIIGRLSSNIYLHHTNKKALILNLHP